MSEYSDATHSSTQRPSSIGIGQDPIDTLASPSGLFCKDYETFYEAKESADQNGQLYLWTYVYNDNGELLYEAGSYEEQRRTSKQQLPERPENNPRGKQQ